MRRGAHGRGGVRRLRVTSLGSRRRAAPAWFAHSFRRRSRMNWPKWLLNWVEKVLPERALMVVDGGDLPDRLPRRDLVLLRDGGEDWSVAMRCPCRCGQRVELA